MMFRQYAGWGWKFGTSPEDSEAIIYGISHNHIFNSIAIRFIVQVDMTGPPRYEAKRHRTNQNKRFRGEYE
jgi:hypothetical protein